MSAVTSSDLPVGAIVDDFVARHLGRTVWRLGDGDDWEPAAAIQAARKAAVGLVSCRIDAGECERARELGRAGFRSVGRLVTFRLVLDGSGDTVPTVGIRDQRDGDVAACGEIARVSFSTDRFHADPAFPDAVADDLKAAWVANAFAGRADHILVCEHVGRVAGFNLCLWRTPFAIIDLIAVAGHARGHGLGAGLIAAMAGLARERGLEAIEAGTQDNNGPACALYRRLGFAPVRTRIDFHWTPDVG